MNWMPQHLLYARESLLWLLILVPLVAILPLVRNRRRRPTYLAIALRGIVLALLVFGLAGPLVAYDGTTVTTIFAIDRSNSIDASAGDAANTWVAGAIRNAGADDSAAIVTFGRQPDLAVPATATGLIGDGWQQPGVDAVTNGDASDLSSALALARSLPVGQSRRIVLLSDGAENQGDALSQADQAAAEGTSIDVVPLAGVDAADLRLASVTGPTALWQGDALSVLATISVGAGGPVDITLSIDGSVAATQQVTLQPGTTSYTLTHPALAPGFHAIDVRVSGSPEIDRIAENDDGALGLLVRDKPTVLMIAPDGADTTKLTTALETQGAQVKVVTPEDAPSTENGFAVYQAIVLNNLPAWTLSADQQNALVARTKDGGGLIAVGGSASFGPGSYAGTALEQALPVTVKVTDGRQRPKVAVMIVVDKSGSMAYDPSSSNTSKLDLAKEGIVTAASALTKGDQIGVIAFNDEPTWALPMTTLTGSGDQQRIKAAIEPLNADGGTEIYPALRLAYDTMRNVNADVRHIILLSDGKSNSGTQDTFDRLVTDNGDDRITLSAIALGTDADTDLLQRLASEGGGRYHFAAKPGDIPSITFQEALSAGSQSVIRGSFTPIQQESSTILTGIDPKTLPIVGGYDFTAAKTGAQTDLTSDRGDPLLVKWQLGLGRVAVWTGDDGSDFASQWATWSDYAPFWGNMLRWTLPDPENRAYTVSAVRDGDDAVVTVDAASAGSPVNLDGESVRATGPNGAAVTLTLVASGPGAYTGRILGAQPGAYSLTLPSTSSTQGDTYGFAVSPSLEWQPSTDGNALLQAIAQKTGGQVLSLDASAPRELFASAGNGDRTLGTIHAIWQYPLLAALIIYLVDIGIGLGFNWRVGIRDVRNLLAWRPGR